MGEGGRPPNPRRGTNRKGRWCAGGDGVGAVGAAGVREREGDVSGGIERKRGGDGSW